MNNILIFIIIVLIILIFIKLYYPYVLASGLIKNVEIKDLILEQNYWKTEKGKKLFKNFFQSSNFQESFAVNIFKERSNMDEQENKAILEEIKKMTFEDFLKINTNIIVQRYNPVLRGVIRVHNDCFKKQTNIDFNVKNSAFGGTLPRGLKIFETGTDYKNIKNIFDNFCESKKITFLPSANDVIKYLNIFDYTVSFTCLNSNIVNQRIERTGHLVLNQLQKLSKDLFEFVNKCLETINYTKYNGPLYISFIKYINNDCKGLRPHIDGMGNIGPVFTVNIGEEVFYDMLPILVPSKDSLRIRIPAGGIVGMTGDSRYKWAHGLPDGIKNLAGKYSIIFRFGTFTQIPQEDMESIY